MKLFFYLLPCMMNVMQGLFFFITARRFAEAGASSLAISATMAVWALVYAVVSALLGLVQTRHNATKLILLGQFVLLLSMIGFLVFPGIYIQYLWLFGTGIGTALFFGPYQAIVKLLDDGAGEKSIARSAAFYTFSWSVGFATGPFITAGIWGLLSPENGWRICYYITIAFLIFMTAFVYFLHCHIGRLNREILPRDADSAAGKPSAVSSSADGLPDLVLTGWIIGGIGFITIAMLRTQIPYRCQLLEMTTGQQGVLLAAVSYVQAFLALTFYKTRRWMYHPWMMSLAALCGLSALLVFAFSSGFAGFLCAAILYGCYSGTFCFLFVYHSLANAEKSHRYVAVNEVIVGVTSVFAPLAAGVLADSVNSSFPFLIGAVLIAVVIVYQISATWRLRKL